MRKHNTIIGYAIFISLFFLLFSCKKEESINRGATTPVLFSEKVKTTTVNIVDIPLFYEAVGTIKASTSTILSSKIQGHIKNIYVNEGRVVKEGDMLILIDDMDIKAKLHKTKAAFESSNRLIEEIDTAISQARIQKKQSEAELSLSQTTFKRFEKLYKENLISEQEFDTAKAKQEVGSEQVNSATQKIEELFAKKESAKAAIEESRSVVEEANVMMSYANIKAPFDGIIVKKYVGVGGLAAPGVPLLSIENPKGFRLEVDVREEEFASKAKVGRKVDVFLDAFGTRKIEGQVAEIVPTANDLSRTFKVKILLPYFEEIKSGMYGKAICSRGERKGILIPETALLKRGQLEEVFFIDKESFARLKLVKTGKKFGTNIEILAGLKAGDTLIMNYYNELKDGYKVEVAK